ncbi:MAG: SPOR domain-containing protein [Thermoanaerobaculaceae bacterium]|nr:SPOR domain-containing protein [Thermoanaerobaculaceae bacterium]
MGRTSAAGQLALWVGRKGKGTARLRWADAELVLYVSGLQIIAAEGDDHERLAAAFGLTDGGEWFAEAAAAVAAGQVSQAEANAVVKRALSERLRDFLMAPDAEASFDSALPFEPKGLTISYPHLVMEMGLGPGGEDLVGVFLPDPALILRRLPDFPKRVGALGLTEEGMAILAKVNDQRTAQEISDPSPHGRDLALRLLAAAAGAGLVEAVSRVAETPLSTQPPRFGLAPRRRIWPRVALVLALVVGAALLLYFRPWEGAVVAGGGGPWAVAVDSGCQPAELERLYRRQEQDKANLRVVPFGRGEGQCYRLVWGHFPSEDAAKGAMAHLPSGVVARGFAPHIVRAESTSP